MRGSRRARGEDRRVELWQSLFQSGDFAAPGRGFLPRAFAVFIADRRGRRALVDRFQKKAVLVECVRGGALLALGRLFRQRQGVEPLALFITGEKGGLVVGGADVEIVGAKPAGVKASGGGAIGGKPFAARGGIGGAVDGETLRRAITKPFFSYFRPRAAASVGKTERCPIGGHAIGFIHAPGAAARERGEHRDGKPSVHKPSWPNDRAVHIPVASALSEPWRRKFAPKGVVRLKSQCAPPARPTFGADAMNAQPCSPTKPARVALLLAAAVSFATFSTPAFAGGRYDDGRGRHYDRGYYGGGYSDRGYSGRGHHRGRGGISGGEAALIAVGIIGGAILIDRALDDRRYDDRRYDDRYDRNRQYESRYDDRRAGDDYYYQRDSRSYDDEIREPRRADYPQDEVFSAGEPELLGATRGAVDSAGVNAAFRECVAETRGAAGAGGMQVAMPGAPTNVETLADGSVRMVAQFRASNGRGQDFTRRFVCEADDRGVRFLQID